jgi:hypothetical protein
VRQAWIAPVVLAPLYGPGALLSGLAPYFLPSTSYALITLGIFFLDVRAKWFLIALGFLTAFHIVSTGLRLAITSRIFSRPDRSLAPFFFQLPTSLLSVGFLHLSLAAQRFFCASGPMGFGAALLPLPNSQVSLRVLCAVNLSPASNLAGHVAITNLSS